MSGTLFSPTAENDDENMVTTMGGLGGLLGQLFPGNQNQPQAVPGLTDLTFTRSFGGPGENFISSLFQDSGQAPRFWSPTGMGATSPLAAPQFEPAQEPLPQAPAYDPFQEAALASLLSQDWSGVEQDLLRRLEATRDITTFMPNFEYAPSFTPSTNIDVSPTINPTLTNIQQQSQEQAQYMGPGTSRQQQEQDDSDVSPESRFDLDSYIRDILKGVPNQGALSSFFL